jgi:anhydro-N-acetylmuramic acid kinase
MPSTYTIIGLMSGTSLDGVDGAILRTDGQQHIETLDFISLEYPDALRAKLRLCLGERDTNQDFIQDAAHDMTLFHAEITRTLMARNDMVIDAIGFHGQTIYHAPGDGITLQIGDAALLAAETGLDVVHDFRSADVKHGGEGAPLLPLYHRAIALKEKLALPITFLNIGGVSNITQINGIDDSEIFACDTGPGNALIDDYVLKATENKYDTGGIIAKSGEIDEACIDKWLATPYFQRQAPKSLDRDAWDIHAIDALNTADAVATLSAFTVRSIAHHIETTQSVYVCGGGRHNQFIMEQLATALNCPVLPIEALHYDGDAIEAQGFAYLAARALQGLPISLPTTTGTKQGTLSGAIIRSAAASRRA